MQAYDGELNYLAKLEEFMRVKGSRRVCEADDKENTKRELEMSKCEEKIAKYDKQLQEIFVSTQLLKTRLTLGSLTTKAQRYI